MYLENIRAYLFWAKTLKKSNPRRSRELLIHSKGLLKKLLKTNIIFLSDFRKEEEQITKTDIKVVA